MATKQEALKVLLATYSKLKQLYTQDPELQADATEEDKALYEKVGELYARVKKSKSIDVSFLTRMPPTINLSNLSEEALNSYSQKIEILSNNELFNLYYSHLAASKNTYTIQAGAGYGGSGSFNPQTNEVSAIDDAFILAQELFHAYQCDLGCYSNKDLSVMETEADLVSYSVALSTGERASGNTWDEDDIAMDFLDDNFMFDERVLSKKFDDIFNKAVNIRIEYYKKQESDYGIKAPLSYIQENSGVGALALKNLISCLKEKK